MRKLLQRARLSKTDKQIAISRLVWRMDYFDIGAAVYMDRKTVSRRMRTQIAPQLTAIIEREKARAGA